VSLYTIFQLERELDRAYHQYDALRTNARSAQEDKNAFKRVVRALLNTGKAEVDTPVPVVAPSPDEGVDVSLSKLRAQENNGP
jgi:hypothetical protein